MTDPALSLINLQADLNRIEEIRMKEGWTFEPWPLTSVECFVTMASRIDSESYTLRFECSGYADEPPSIKCVNPESKDSMDPHAWPNCEGFRPPPTADLCLNISREGLRQIHPHWQNDGRIAWEPSGNPIWRILQALQDRISDPAKYHGRAR